MSGSVIAVTALVAVLAVWLAVRILVRLAEAWRTRRYAVHRAIRKSLVSEKITSLSLRKYDRPLRAEGFRNLVASDHAEAISAQTQYFSHATAIASGVGVAFTVTAVAATLVHEPTWLKLGLALSDAAVLSLVFYHFWAGRRAHAAWIRARAQTEMLRRFIFLILLFPSTERGHVGGLTALYQRERELLKARLSLTPLGELAEQVREHWVRTRSRINEMQLLKEDVTPSAVLYYVDKRVLRQEMWFRASLLRVSHTDHLRSRILELLFGSALLLALSKAFIVFMPPQNSDVVTEGLALSLLMLSGLVGAITTWHISQNTRGLIHQYASQARLLEKRADELFLPALRSSSGLTELSEESQKKIVEAALAFEDCMTDELVDWINSSHRNTVELGP